MASLREDGRPLYVRAPEVLEEYIATHDLRAGERLPSETELARLLGVSRTTIREGLRELELRGKIERHHGRGTTVATPPVVAGLDVLESLESLAEAQGWICGTQDVVVDQALIPDDAARALDLPGGTEVTRLSRVKTRDGNPFGVMTTWFPPDIKTPDSLEQEFVSSITDLLGGGDDAVLDFATASITAAAADGDEANALGVAEGAPLVVLFETFFQRPRRTLCFSRNVFIPGSAELAIVRRMPDRG